MYNIFIVRSIDTYEPDWRDITRDFDRYDYWAIRVPDRIPQIEVFDAFDIAKKYANHCGDFNDLSDEEGIEKYDKHFPMMRKKYYDYNGCEIFNGYITDVCGWSVNEYNHAFQYSYEW